MISFIDTLEAVKLDGPVIVGDYPPLIHRTLACIERNRRGEFLEW